jgi:hypothetical protein
MQKYDYMHWWQLFSLAPFMKILAFATKWQFSRKVAILLPLSGSSIFSLHAGYYREMFNRIKQILEKRLQLLVNNATFSNKEIEYVGALKYCRIAGYKIAGNY